MNIVKDLVTRIEKRLTETKKPCNLYATEERAELTAEHNAKLLADYFAKTGTATHPARYVVVFIPSVGKWAVGFDQTEVMNRSTSTGGYAGVMSARGFYTF